MCRSRTCSAASHPARRAEHDRLHQGQHRPCDGRRRLHRLRDRASDRAVRSRLVVLFGRGENSLHQLEQELRRDLPELQHVTVVGSVCDPEKVAEVLSAYRPEVLFHSAAHKHVPMMQLNPDEAVLNNVGGTLIIAAAAMSARVERFVNISSDKAVNPVSMLVSPSRSPSRSCVERRSRRRAAGLRLGSIRQRARQQGSVVPLFQQQIRTVGRSRSPTPRCAATS